MLGTRMSQAGWLVAGIAFLHGIFRGHPDAKVLGMGNIPFLPLALFALILIVTGMSTGWFCLRALESGKIVSGRVVKIEADNSGDETEYKVSFEYRGELGESRIVRATRSVQDLSVAQEVSILVDQQGEMIRPEAGLPGGVTFAHAFGREPVPGKCFARVALVPGFSLGMLTCLLPQIYTVSQKTVWLDQPAAPMLIIFGECFWLFANRKHFLI